MPKLIQAVRRHPRRWGALLVLSGAALVLAGSLISTRDVTAQPGEPQQGQQPPPDIAPASLTPFQTFSSNADRGTRVVVSTHGNVIEFNSPNTAGADYDHIAAGTIAEGYMLCYTPQGGTQKTTFDLAASGENGFGAATNLTGPVRVNRATSDGILQLNQTFTFNGQNKALTIKMVVRNNSGAPVTGILLSRVVDFDVDSGGPNGGWDGFNDWHAIIDTQGAGGDSVFAWSERDAYPTGGEAHGMILRHLTQSGGVSHRAAIHNLTCGPPETNTPIYGDLADGLVYSIPNLAAGASKTINIQYQRY